MCYVYSMSCVVLIFWNVKFDALSALFFRTLNLKLQSYLY